MAGHQAATGISRYSLANLPVELAKIANPTASSIHLVAFSGPALRIFTIAARE